LITRRLWEYGVYWQRPVTTFRKVRKKLSGR